MKHVSEFTLGQLVVALRAFERDEHGADVVVHERGVVFSMDRSPRQSDGSWLGPLVRWFNGGQCHVREYEVTTFEEYNADKTGLGKYGANLIAQSKLLLLSRKLKNVVADVHDHGLLQNVLNGLDADDSIALVRFEAFVEEVTRLAASAEAGWRPPSESDEP